MIVKIISGGQTGGDEAGLEAGYRMGIETGGYCPKSWKTHEGPNFNLRDKYNLIETKSNNYSPRTRLNIVNSNLTIGFGKKTSSGMKLTYNICDELHKPYFHIDYPAFKNGLITNRKFKEIVKFLKNLDNGVTLNVAGNREHTNPGIYDFTLGYIIELIREVNGISG